MMAKMFYTLDEAKAALGKSEEEIKQFSRDGRLREFRDGPRLMFKADQVETLKADLAGEGGEHMDLGPSDSGMAIGLADSKLPGSGLGSGLAGSGLVGSGLAGGGGSGLGGSGLAGSGIAGSGLGGSGLGGSGLSGTGLGGSVAGMSASGISLVDSQAGHSSGTGMTLKDDTALAADLGLSGSIGGVPSPGRPAGSGTGLSGSHGSKAGIDVFQNDEVERVDPSAQTAMSPGISDMGDGVGSGSGLLDLTRESDDTSLGAELLDEIAPGGTVAGRRGAGDTGAGTAVGQRVVEIRGGGAGASRAALGAGVVYEEEPDSMAPAFGAAALGASLVVIFGAYALITGVLETGPDILAKVTQFGFLGVAGGGLAVTLIFFVVGLIIGKSTAR